MQVTETLNEGLKRGYAITVTAAELDAKVNEKLVEAQPEVEMKGFRKGKVPMALLKKQMRLPAKTITKTSIVTPTQAKEVMSKRQWKTAEAYITRNDPKTVVVPVDDKREALNFNPFEVLPNE